MTVQYNSGCKDCMTMAWHVGQRCPHSSVNLVIWNMTVNIGGWVLARLGYKAI